MPLSSLIFIISDYITYTLEKSTVSDKKIEILFRGRRPAAGTAVKPHFDACRPRKIAHRARFGLRGTPAVGRTQQFHGFSIDLSRRNVYNY